MKKFNSLVCIILFVTGFCFGQSTDPADWNPNDVFGYYGKQNEIGKDPVFADDSESIYFGLKEKKLVPLARFTETVSVPVTVFCEKDGDTFKCLSYSISDEYKKYDEVIKDLVEERIFTNELWKFSNKLSDVPKFLLGYMDNPTGTKVTCEMFAVIIGRDLKFGQAFPLKIKDNVIDANGNSKKKNRTILVLLLNEPQFKFSDDGKISEIIIPEKEKIETPFGVMELFIDDLNLPTKLSNKKTLGSYVINDFVDYKKESVVSIINEDELRAIYQTRKGVDLRNNKCAKVSAFSLREKDGEIYLGSIHLLCTDNVWDSLHTDIIRKDLMRKYVIDLCLIDGKIQCAISFVREFTSQGDFQEYILTGN